MATNYKTAEEVPESWLDRCTDNGYERYTDEDGNLRYRDNGELVSDMPFRPCARCGEYPNERGDDHCIHNLGRVVNACCGHGTHDGYVMFDDGTIIRGRFTVERPEEPLPQTNFQRITESPEKFAEFINDLIPECARYPSCDSCPLYGHCDADEILEWLQEECNE